MEIDRRTLLAGTGAALMLAGCKAAEKAAEVAKSKFTASPALAELEKKSGGRLGAYILDSGTGNAIGHHPDERFAHCSTFKLSLGAAVLQLADQGKLKLDEVLAYTKADLLSNSPETEANLAKGGMTVEALARAAQVTSDNAAANLVMRHIGGPEKLTAFWRSLGDEVSRVDDYEPAMNKTVPGDPRNTSSAGAMAQSMAKFLTCDVLSETAKKKLFAWMVNTRTGQKRIRAGLPSEWRAGDKTGTFDEKVNDIAIVWVPKKKPLLITAYYEGTGKGEEKRAADEAVLAEVGRIAAEWAKA